MSREPARRPSILLWIAPPAFAAIIGSWSVEHRMPAAEDTLVAARDVAESGPAFARPHSRGRIQVGDPIPPGTSAIRGVLIAPNGAPSESGVEVGLAREDVIEENSPRAFRCCEGCAYSLIDEYCDRAPQVFAGLTPFEVSGPAAGRVTTTKADGRFAFDGIPSGRYVVWARPNRGAIATVHEIELADRETREVAVVSTFQTFLSGTVLSADGSALEGATVVAIDPRLGDRTVAVTRENGEFELDGLDQRVHYYVAAFAPGMAPVGRTGIAPGDELSFELEEAAGIAGVVTRGGAPIPGAKVELDEFVRTTVSGADGRFKFSDLGPGIHVLRASSGGEGQRLEFELARGLVRSLTMDLSRVCTLIVRVRDGQGPLAAADVRLLSKDSIDHRATKSDERGTAVFDMLRVGAYEIDARRPDRGKGTMPVRLEEGCSSREETIAIQETAGVRGRIVDERDQPITDVDISVGRLDASSDSGDDIPRTARTNERGMFRVPSLAPGTWELTAIRPGFIESVTSFEVEDRSSDVELEVVLTRGGIIQGRVVDPQDRPVAGWLVTAVPPGLEALAAQDDVSDVSLGERRMTSADGVFVLSGLKPGEYVVEARPPRSEEKYAYEKADVGTPQLRAKTGDRDVVLKTRGTGELQGEVTFTGAPAPQSFSVGVPGVGVRTFEGSAGKFRIESALVGSYPILLHARGFSNALVRVEVTIGERAHVAVKMHAAVRLLGRVVDDREDRPIGEATVTAVRTEASGERIASTATSRRDGIFELLDLAPGEHWLTVQADGYARTRIGPVVATPGKKAVATEIRLTHASVHVAGRVRRAEAALADAQVMLHLREPKESKGLVEMTRADSRGMFRFDSVEPGVHSLTIAARPRGARGEVIVHRRLLTIPDAGLEDLDLDVLDRQGKHRLIVQLPASRRDPLLVTLRKGRLDEREVAARETERIDTADARAVTQGQREVVFDRLAPGAYTVAVGQIAAEDGDETAFATAPVRNLVVRHVQVPDKARETRVAFDGS
jgi:large repetitive protein